MDNMTNQALDMPGAFDDLPTRPYKRGDVVFANHVIVHGWQSEDGYNEGIYICAAHGQIGIIEDVLESGELRVNFHGTGDSVVLPEDVNPYQGFVARR